MVDYFPRSKNGSHKVLTHTQIARKGKRLVKTIGDFDPQIVVPVGRLSISYCLEKGVEPLVKNIGKIYSTDPYGLFGEERIIIPFSYPSGASTWYSKKENKKLLQEALYLLRQNL